MHNDDEAAITPPRQTFRARRNDLIMSFAIKSKPDEIFASGSAGCIFR